MTFHLHILDEYSIVSISNCSSLKTITVINIPTSGPEVIKLFSCSAQLSMKFFLLINVKMPTIFGSLTFMSRKNSILGLSESGKAEFLDIFILMSI